MVDNDDQMNLDSIPESMQQTLKDFVRDIQDTLPGQLASVTVVGSCLSTEFSPGLSDITTVLVNLDTLKPTRIDPELRNILEQFLSGAGTG